MTAIYPTMLSVLISRLQEMLEKHGDIPVVAYAPEGDRTSRVSAGILEQYYDGGWLDPAEDTPYHCRHWMMSRTTKANKLAVLIRADEPEFAFAEDPPEYRDTIDGEPVPDCEDDLRDVRRIVLQRPDYLSAATRIQPNPLEPSHGGTPRARPGGAGQ